MQHINHHILFSDLESKLIKMDKIKLTFPDGAIKDFDTGITGEEIARGISEGLLRKSICIKVGDELLDLSTPIHKSGEMKIITFQDDEGKKVYRHSSAHLMAQAIQRLFPDAKLTIGPVVDEGFYYDIDCAPFVPEDIAKIEEEMKKITKEDLKLQRRELSTKEALELFKGNPYKQEIIKNIEEFGEGATEKSDIVSIYTQGEFSDLCRGPHVPKTGMIKAFKIMKIAGAYWRGDVKNKQLQRVYGISFADKKELDEYLFILEEAKKRDHKKIGKDLDLYSFQEEAPGMPFFHNKGAYIWNKLVQFITEKLEKNSYELVKTPLIMNISLWKQSGHWDHYKDNMYSTKIDNQDFGIKPMNCPGHLLIYKNKRYSYRDLPLRMGEFGLVHRHELSGVLNGLFRVRAFTQDDAHIFCTKEQMIEEIKALLKLVDDVYKTFGFSFKIELSTKPEHAMGELALWELAEKTLETTLTELNLPFIINKGDGAFYGPKIDFHLRDSLGRTWQCGTIQLDFQMPEKFDLTYDAQDGTRQRVVMLHRTILGSVERFLGILVEHYAGKFPLWLSPEQVRILTIADRHNIYADKVADILSNANIRVTKDYSQETMNKKIRNAQLDQINYIVVVGDKEEETETVNVRTRDNIVHGEKKVSDFLKDLLDEIKNKTLPKKQE